MKHVVVVATCYCLVRPLLFYVRLTFVDKETVRFLKPPFIWMSKINTKQNAVMVCVIVNHVQLGLFGHLLKATCWKQVIFSCYDLELHLRDD